MALGRLPQSKRKKHNSYATLPLPKLTVRRYILYTQTRTQQQNVLSDITYIKIQTQPNPTSTSSSPNTQHYFHYFRLQQQQLWLLSRRSSVGKGGLLSRVLTDAGIKATALLRYLIIPL